MKRYIGKRALSGLLVVLLSVCFNFMENARIYVEEAQEEKRALS